MDAKATLAGLVFRPEDFFLGRTEGSGLVRDPFGRVSRRCEIVTVGEPSPGYGVIKLEETFAYDDGEVDVWRWAITAAGDGRYVAAEAKAGSGITGHRAGDDYLLSFNRPVAGSPLAPHFTTRFTLLDRDVALKTVRVALFGVPVGSMSAIHRRIR